MGTAVAVMGENDLMDERLRDVLSHFALEGTLLSVEPLKKGHINDTYVATTGSKKYVLQKVNRHVFQNIPELMENLTRVTAHIRTKIKSGEAKLGDKTLSVIPTQAGATYIQHEDGEYWRVFNFMENAESYYVCHSAEKAYKAAGACGRFQRYIADLAPADFHDTIPLFHNTPNRYRLLREAIDADPMDRVNGVAEELEFAMAREEFGRLVLDAIEAGAVPLRVTHNDLKYNNVMFDTRSGEAIGVVDLDTCMPGTVLYDFGDLVRNSSVPANEDETDLEKVFMDPTMYEALVRGYLDESGSLLVPGERELFALCPKLITLTIGIRFLTDYLLGDKYFKIARPTHNLDRARNQFKVVSSMEGQEKQMRALAGKRSPFSL